MGEGLSSSPLSPEYCPFPPVSLPTRRDTHILPSASDSNHKLTLIFITLLGNVWSDNRDFAFILYAWLGYCCFSPLPWFSPFPGISPDFACNTGRQCAPELHVNNWCISRHFCTLEKGRSLSGENWRTFNGRNWCFLQIYPTKGKVLQKTEVNLVWSYWVWTTATLMLMMLTAVITWLLLLMKITVKLIIMAKSTYRKCRWWLWYWQ